MGSVEINPSLPIIDISPFLSATSSRSQLQECAQKLNNACVETGFFYLTGHGIPTTVTDRILSTTRAFFLDSTDEEKDRIKRLEAGVDYGDGARGYQKVGENVTKGRRDWHEAIDLYREWDELGADTTSPPHGLLRGKNLIPDSPADLKTALCDYIEEMKRLGTAVVRAMGDALDLDETSKDVFVDATDESFWVFRLIGYPGLPPRNDDGEAGVSCGEHTDYGCVTLLLADPTPGALQVQSKSGSWINADPLPGAIVVNIGDMMERWTNGLWKSTNHRVVHKASNYRVSVPFFFEPNFDAKVAPLKECIDRTGGVRKYEEVMYGDWLEGKIRGNFY